MRRLKFGRNFLFLLLFVVIFGFVGTPSPAYAGTYTFTCGSPSTDATATTCEVLRERIEAETASSTILDSDLQWLVYSVGMIAGFIATGYGLHSLRRSIFGKPVTGEVSGV